MKIKPFKGIRPPKELVEQVSSRPYDVLSSEEARAEAAGNEMSLYHIIKPEINFPPFTDEHDPRVYLEAKQQFQRFKLKGWLVQDLEERYYVYAQTIPAGHRLAVNGERTQYGLVVGAWVDDYLEGRIKKHELTRKDKEEDRMKHVRTLNANMEPVFFAYPHRADLDAIVAKVTRNTPEYDFVAAPEGFRHTFWVIEDPKLIAQITAIFAEIPAMYIADGHHRSAAAARVGAELRQCTKDNVPCTKESDFFMAVCFPENQLNIIDYNRVVKDLNGLTDEEFLKALEENFEIKNYELKIKNYEAVKPKGLHQFSLYLGGKWYSLKAKAGRYNDADPIGVLDVTISSNLILDKILGIKDLRTDKRIDFVGGIRGLGELEKRVDSGEWKAALALYPVTMQQIIDIADSGNILPPKTTWFEPKLRSGLVVHELN